MVSFVGRLRSQLEAVEEAMIQLLDISTISEIRNDPNSMVVWVGHPYFWGEPDAKQKQLQMRLLRDYAEWFQRFQLLLRNIPEEMNKQIQETNEFVRRWIEKRSGWDTPATIEEAKPTFRERIRVFRDFLDLRDSGSDEAVIVVPDTNALIASPDAWAYRHIGNTTTYTFVILPTVLEELDKLKVNHRDPQFRSKVSGVISRIKGLRQQGALLAGVIVHKTVTVKMVAKEPVFSDTLEWLDPASKDDRIIASVLELQAEHPAAIVVLVTADLNLQNKAEMANLPHAEPP